MQGEWVDNNMTNYLLSYHIIIGGSYRIISLFPMHILFQNPDCGSDSTEVTLSGDSDLDINTMMELKQAAASAKPLMYPRVRSRQHVGKLHYRPCWARILWPCVYMFIVACALGAVGFLCVYVIERYHLLDHIIPVDSHKSTATQKTTPDLR